MSAHCQSCGVLRAIIRTLVGALRDVQRGSSGVSRTLADTEEALDKLYSAHADTEPPMVAVPAVTSGSMTWEQIQAAASRKPVGVR